jgi:DNA-binding GntR family transcriptional regulator
MILAGELPAGTKLNEASVAELLGVSRGPVREAFRALEESGLVRLEKNRGVFVRQIDIAEADEIYELRALLDDFVGRRVAQSARPDDVQDLRGLIDRMDKAAAKHDLDAYHAANLAFHDRLVELAGNTKLLGMYPVVNEHRLHSHDDDRRWRMSLSSHQHTTSSEDRHCKAAAARRALSSTTRAAAGRMHEATRRRTRNADRTRKARVPPPLTVNARITSARPPARRFAVATAASRIT